MHHAMENHPAGSVPDQSVGRAAPPRSWRFPAGSPICGSGLLWRVSSAQVELPHSVFTSLPDYDRFLSTLEGELVLEIDGSGRRTLQPLEVCQFDGGLRVESWGKCRDFNLMLRKGRCTGEMTALHLVGGERRLCQWDADVAGLYCCTGSLGWLQAGQFALADRRRPRSWRPRRKHRCWPCGSAIRRSIWAKRNREWFSPLPHYIGRRMQILKNSVYALLSRK